MFAPFIFIAINRIRPGKFGDEKRRVPGLCDFIEANEPQLIAFNEYASEDGTEVGVVQIHRDAHRWSFTWRLSLTGQRRPTPRRSKPRRASRSTASRARLF
jgi:hypothetical protein